MAKVISFLNKKGGCGKTTCSTNLACGLSFRGYKVLLVDADPARTLRKWDIANGGRLVTVIGLDTVTLPVNLLDSKELYDVIVIDGAPHLEDLIGAAIRASDVVLIPVQPTPYDIWASADLVDVINRRKEVYGAPEAAFILSRVIKNTKLSKEARIALEQSEIITFDSFTSQSIKYPTADENGSSVFGEFFKRGNDLEFVKKVTPISIEFDLIVDEVIERFLNGKIVKVA